MSSLKEQLAQVAASNATVALDRKRRQKLHSASLIYNPKTAATQDYDFIFDNATSALEELVEIDVRFKVFSRSLFSASSVNIDRNTQTKEQVRTLDQAVNAYLMLASAWWHLTPTLHATEWLVRRFQIHVHNAEMLLLSTLNYYQSPVFKRILNIVKLPPLFSSLANFAKAESVPSNLTIVKLFNDMDFLTLYTSYVGKVVKQKVTYTNQLLFNSCAFINLVAFNSNSEEKLERLVPILLEVCAKLLASPSDDCQMAAHTVLVVLVTALPLKKQILLAATETILANLADSASTKRCAFVTVCKLFQTLKGHGNVDQLPANIYTLFDSKISNDCLIDFLSKKETPADKFVTSYVRSIARYDHGKLNSIVSILKQVKLEKFEVRLIITDLIHLSELLEDKSQLIQLFEFFISIDEDMVLRCLHSLNLTGELFEIRLTTSLFSAERIEPVNGEDVVKGLEASKVAGLAGGAQPFTEFLNKNSAYICTKNISLLVEDDEQASKLLSLFVESVGKKYQPGLFLSSFFTTLESRITFLLRIIVSPGAPVALRLISVSNLSKLIHTIGNDTNVFTLVPVLIVALTDISKNVRAAVKKVLHQISKRPFTKRYFLNDKIYGEGQSVPMLNPKESESWLKTFLDGYLVENYDISQLLIPKKNEKMYLLFWANQALYMPLPQPKLVLMRFLARHESFSSTYSQLWENFLSSYLEQRPQWELKCSKNKTNFCEFESVLVLLLSKKEKNPAAIEFLLGALKSPFEQLASIMAKRLIEIYPTLKQPVQCQIVQDIIESTASADLSYDSIETLQSLALSADVVVSVIKQNMINVDETSNIIKKRRRRSSASNKAALQKEEVSRIAEIHLRKLTILLEALDKIKVQGSEALLTSLFDILADLDTLDNDGGLPVLYAQETLASCMLHTIDSLRATGATPKLRSVRTDILVAAIRASSSPQVQNKLLLVISALALLNPELVLHSIMPIFTFMGAHSLRQDDEFSTMVVEKTVKTVVPALLESGSSSMTDEIEFLLMSFSTAFSHVPKHRRVRLFTTLIKTLQPSSSIAPFLFLLSQQFSAKVENFEIAESKSILEFSRSFMSKFAVLDQLTGIAGLFELVKLLSEPDLKDKTSPRTLLSNGILNYTPSEMFNYKRNTFDFMDKILAEDNQGGNKGENNLKLKLLSALLDPQTEEQVKSDVKDQFAKVLQHNLVFINNVEELCSTQDLTEQGKSDGDESGSEPDNDNPVADMTEILFSLLGHILDLLPISTFVESILPLLGKDTEDIIRKHLTLVIGTKFESEPNSSATYANMTASSLLAIVTDEAEAPGVVQAALNTTSTLVSKFGDRLDASTLTECLKIGVQKLNSSSTDIVVSALAVLTNTVHVLGVKSIGFYAKIVPRALAIFDSVQDTKSDLRKEVQLSVVLLFAAMMKRIPSFLQSNLKDVMRAIFFADEVQNSISLYVISLLVQQLDLKEVLKTLYRIWTTDISKTGNSVAVSLFLTTLESTVEAIDKKSATSQSPTFFKLLLAMFEYRSVSTFDNNTISRIEASVHQIANIYVLKLNDKIFRPLFALTVRWAFDGESVSNLQITKVERLTAFFKFFNKLQESLKSIITSYFTYLLEPTNALLNDFHSGAVSDTNLRRLTLTALTASFKYDRDEYWKSTARFELLAESLVNQLANIEDSIGKYLVKAIAALASNNAGVDEHSKLLHRALVEHMKASCATSQKLWAVKATKLIYAKVGEHWLVLLPQLVPVIAELLEDDDEEVEQEVRTGLVKVVETVLGEPFDRYLT
ncbi:AFR074Cp [Eremothecium gossypii ATCC 10895]|uniref:U3 small nucleolar RNA-associated protein 10 n=1 Tax=Eremothecium gossypii (strain ATCC 10895 / CBS 109.51 / FGSC 9923 / NRRL Y-1056) TaxID=284811 RepID=UTP10_EREGS|nr:AFR074Cp [Eremothecium gossypii ATCC 10895]Q754J8.1 RecName: Full=U3 small nucleolar RNA-associated protein 10 [Eremothecium gossypii ATCC 10895]AAS53445.1 AFR074Cp [Eremothecium gossypii ATCC 10895]AEY97757.1 FAFR074Cp [Eremothecium gossypii FDAG1]